MPRTSAVLPGLALALVLAGTAPLDAQTTRTQLEDYRIVTVAEGLEVPWSIAWLPNGDMLVTERPGRLRIVRDGSLLSDPVGGTPAVRARGQGGLLDVAVHPDFASNQLVYLSFSKPNADDSEGTTAVIRGRLDGTQLVDVEEIFEAQAWSQTNGHYGSRLAFDDEGHLFITVGDRQASPSGNLEAHPSQDLSNHQGAMIRLNDDGSVPDDNPFAGQAGALPEIWSYGHRSPQGFLIDPATGNIWESEHGPQGGDEINLIRGGSNYGWPVIGWGVNYGPGTPIHESRQREGMEQPAHVWVPSIGSSGLMLYSGDRFPEWRGDLFSGGLARQQIVRLELDGTDVVGSEVILRGERVRDIRQGPDGYIYVASESPGRILRLEPAM